jgi:hypothetical protein
MAPTLLYENENEEGIIEPEHKELEDIDDPLCII